MNKIRLGFFGLGRGSVFIDSVIQNGGEVVAVRIPIIRSRTKSISDT